VKQPPHKTILLPAPFDYYWQITDKQIPIRD